MRRLTLGHWVLDSEAVGRRYELVDSCRRLCLDAAGHTYRHGCWDGAGDGGTITSPAIGLAGLLEVATVIARQLMATWLHRSLERIGCSAL